MDVAMNKRTRSPNYPSISLPDALQRLKGLWDSIQGHAAPREVVASGIGYAKLHGASATAISALQKYGLLERSGDGLKISERGKKYLQPLSEDERSGAIREAAMEPVLFSELNKQFPGGTRNDELLRNYLSRQGYSQSALPHVLHAYRDTLDLVEQNLRNYNGKSEKPSAERPDEGRKHESRGGSMSPATMNLAIPVPDPGKFLVSMTNEFFVDISASKLDRTGVTQLVKWLNANAELVPETPEQDKETNDNE